MAVKRSGCGFKFMKFASITQQDLKSGEVAISAEITSFKCKEIHSKVLPCFVDEITAVKGIL
jgi:hypothetical protein